jgi:hypothetical protein
MRRTGRGRAGRWSAALVLAGGLVLAGPTPADAHDELAGSSPASGATVRTALTAVTLRFEQTPADVGRGSTVLQVTGQDGTHYETSCAGIDGAAVRARVALGPSGTYAVTWRVVSDDGHPVSGAYSFPYVAPNGATVSQGSANGPECGITSSGASTTSTPTAGPPLGLLVGGGAAVLLLVGAATAGAIVLSRRTARIG